MHHPMYARMGRAAGMVACLVLLGSSRIGARGRGPGPPAADGLAARAFRLAGLRDEYGRIDPLAAGRARAGLRRALARPEVSPPRGAWKPRGIGLAGRARSLVIHPARPDVMWLATGSGGVWKTDDGGASWRPLTDAIGLPSGSLVLDPRNADHLYWGTGERFHAGGPGAGLWESTNGGESWMQMASTSSWPYVDAIVVSRRDPGLILASAPGATSRESAIYRSTDAGASWRPSLQTDNVTFDLVADPSDPSRLVAAARQRFEPSPTNTYVYLSTDAGETWKVSQGSKAPENGQGMNRMTLAFAPSDPKIVYALSKTGLLRSEDGGASFKLRNASPPTGIALWTEALWVSPSDPSLLFVGGGGLTRSTDGGLTFTPNQNGGHVDTQQIVSAPAFDGAANRRLFVLNDGGIFVVEDALAASLTVRSLNANLQTTEVWAAAGSAPAGLLLSAVQDSAMQRIPIAGTGAPIRGGEGDGACAIFDSENARLMYGCAQALHPVRLDPDGGPGESLYQTLHDVQSMDALDANFVAPVLLDPGAPWRMLAGGHSLWKCENVRDAHQLTNPAVWTEIKPRLTYAADFDENVLSSVAVAERDSNVIWAAYNAGRVFRTANGLSAAPRWETVDDNGELDPFPNRRPLRILIDREDARRVFVAFGGFSEDNLWVTTDGGATWTARAGVPGAALPPAPVWSMAQHPARRDTFYAGTELGVFQSEDAGATWRPISAGAFHVAAQDIGFVRGTTTLLVGTFGRGLWTLDTERVPCLCRRPPSASPPAPPG